jgi:hypothetical protein
MMAITHANVSAVRDMEPKVTHQTIRKMFHVEHFAIALNSFELNAKKD